MNEQRKQPAKLTVDLSLCGGHGRCRDEAPMIFGYDGVTNKSCVLAGADVDAHRDAVERAIIACPERAISWAHDEPHEDGK